ncbi:MAG: GNAT family N-acetyltransferase [Candidatus Helarchaeota archaeon]
MIYDKSKLEITPLTKDDIFENLELLNQIIKENHFLASRREISEVDALDFYNYWVKSDLGIYLVAKYEKKIIGHISNRPREEDRLSHIGYVGYLVHPDFRKLGIGTNMLQKVIEYSLKKGFEILVCEVSHDNNASLALLRKFQFQEFGRLKNGLKVNDGNYRDIILLSKHLL